MTPTEDPDCPPPAISRLPSGRFAPGQSGNPKGRPVGSRNRSTILAELLAEGETEQLARAEVEKALKGHAPSRRFVLSRVMARGRPIRLDLPDDADPETGLLEVQRRLAAGEILPDEALKLARFFAARRRDELEKPKDEAADDRNWFIETLENVTNEAAPAENVYSDEYQQRRDEGVPDDMAHRHAQVARKRYELARAERVLRGEIGVNDRWDWRPVDGPLPEPDPDWVPLTDPEVSVARAIRANPGPDLKTTCNLQVGAGPAPGREAAPPGPARRGG